MLHALRTDAFNGQVIATSDTLLRYLRFSMAHCRVEEVRVLFLNVRNHLLADRVMWQGCVQESPLFVREIMKLALDLGATALIVVHNHPSGDPEPSSADIELTRKLYMASKSLDVAVHDHLIVAREGWVSFRQRGLL